MDVPKEEKRLFKTTYFVVIIIGALWCDETNAQSKHDLNIAGSHLRQLSQNYSDICRDSDMCDKHIPNTCCGYCSCQSRCFETGTCCPSALESFWEVKQPTQECIPLSYKAPEDVRRHFMIASCPVTFKDDAVVKKCENRHSASDLLSFLPVGDRLSGNTYTNRYCAECHLVNSENFVNWNAQVQCNYTAFTPRNLDTVLTDISETVDCDLMLIPTRNDPRKSCHSLISSCNETGLWEEYDTFMYQACRLFLAPYMKNKYRNPFCAVCNGIEIDTEAACDTGGSELRPSRDLVPFSALLQFRPELETEQNGLEKKCSADQIYDPFKDVCRHLECSFGRILTNASCAPAFKRTSGVCYKVTVQFTVTKNKTGGVNDKELLLNDTDDTLITTFEGKIISFLEKNRIHRYVNNISFYKVGDSGKGDIILADFLIDVQNQIDVEVLTLQVNRTFNGQTLIHANSENESYNVGVDLIRIRSATVGGIVSPWTQETMSPVRVSQIDPYMQAKCVGEAVIITSFSFQPFIRINHTSYNWTIGPFGVKIHGLDIFIENALFRESEDGSTLFVSVTALNDVFKKFADRTDIIIIVGGASEVIQGILSLVLVGTSILCSMFTVIVYAVLPSLRSQPGINNMILSVFLIIAYALFLGLSSQPESDIVCALMGGATHFAWLMVFLWMNICSFHMFRVFGLMNNSHSSSAGIKFTTCVYIIYCVVSSSAIVAVNIGVTHYTSNGESNGYGAAKTGFCYIYDPTLSLFVITIPCLVIVTANLIMFFIVVYRLRSMTNVKRHVRNDRNYFLIHIRLSTITGMTWIVALPMVLTNLVVFSYVYIVLVCSQGVYLMIAFVCNKRVFNLLMNKLTSKTVSRTATYETNITDTMSGSQMSRTATLRSEDLNI